MKLDSPTLSGLRCFEAAARHLSFTKAAQALNLTQSAVSQQIRNLEARLGYALFLRQYRNLTLTGAGTVLYESTARAFRELEQTLNQLAPSEAALQVNCLPSFALEWLMPRFVEFQRLHPKITVRLKAEFQSLDLQAMRSEAIDLAVRYDPGYYQIVHAEPILTEYLLPVATPDYLAAHPAFATGESLGDVVLLHDSTPWTGAPEFIEWRSWLEAVRPDWLASLGGVQFNLSSLAIGAARNHQGVAMARSATVLEEIQSGRLVNVFGRLVRAPAQYMLLIQDQKDPRAAIFAKWLKQECLRFDELRQEVFGLSE
jgi:LysR family glycine cleavage system transcriptional activator